MNVPDLRNVDFDAYRQRAHELRRQATQESIDRAVAWLVNGLKRRRPSRTAAVVRARSQSAQCAA
jgi:hypothetical protein